MVSTSLKHAGTPGPELRTFRPNNIMRFAKHALSRPTATRARYSVQIDPSDDEFNGDSEEEEAPSTSTQQQDDSFNKVLDAERPPSSFLQFSTHVYYAESDDGYVDVDVMRIGSTSEAASVEYETLNGAAVAGLHYGQSTGTIEFGIGEFMASIRVRLDKSDVWQPPLDFTVRLVHPSAGAAINSTALDRCRIWILHIGPYAASLTCLRRLPCPLLSSPLLSCGCYYCVRQARRRRVSL